MRINILEAGKTLSIDGVKIVSIEDYWRWKENTSLNANNLKKRDAK